MSLLTKSQASKARAKAKARAGAASAQARQQARRAAAQAGPLRASARATARKGIRHARTWAAPRLERTGHTLEERVAPRMAAMLSAAARRIEPVPPRRRRWPMLAAGLATAAGLSATAAYLLKRRGSAGQATEHTSPVTGSTTATPAEPAAPVASSEVNGRVHTS